MKTSGPPTFDASPISSARLDLLTLTPNVLRLSLAADSVSTESRLGLTVPQAWYQQQDLFRLRLGQLEEDPTYLPWSVRAISLRAAKQLVGYIGFHTKPGHPYLHSTSPTAVEFGFEVFPPHRRRGYAREACIAIMHWAHHQAGVPDFVVSISPDNTPSLKLARSLGFVRVGSHVDEVDGPEDVFLLRYPAGRGV